jgi:hypothetical protein
VYEEDYIDDFEEMGHGAEVEGAFKEVKNIKSDAMQDMINGCQSTKRATRAMPVSYHIRPAVVCFAVLWSCAIQA